MDCSVQVLIGAMVHVNTICVHLVASSYYTHASCLQPEEVNLNPNFEAQPPGSGLSSVAEQRGHKARLPDEQGCRAWIASLSGGANLSFE